MILIDNTVLSNFALAQNVPLIADFCGDKGRITEQVLAEFEQGVQQGILPNISLDWLKRVKLRGPREHARFLQLRTRLGAGESWCLAIAMARGYAILTDDRKQGSTDGGGARVWECRNPSGANTENSF